MDGRKRRDGAYLDQLGVYYPARQPEAVEISADKAIEWLKKGAQPSDTVRSLLSREGIMARLDALKKGADSQVALERGSAVKAAAAARAEKARSATAARKKTAAPAAETPAPPDSTPGAETSD